MLYYFFQYLEILNVPGAGVFQYISFRAGMALILSLVIATVYGRRVISQLQILQIGEEIRNLGLEGQFQKKGTPTMGGFIILGSIIIPTFLLAQIHNVYVILMLITTIWLGALGFADDYIKVFKKNKAGLHGKYKILGQLALGLIVGLTLYLSDDVVIRKSVYDAATQSQVHVHMKSTITSIPFFKNNELDYSWFTSFMGNYAQLGGWIVFVIAVILITTAVSNGANLTDGLDGLLTGLTSIIGVTLGILAYVSGNSIFADYLNIMFIPNTGELVIFASALIGATVGFLWYNAYPAQVFMGDTGSLALGGIIAVFAIIIRKELLIPILCGIFLVENLSVMMQVSYFKYTKKKFGEGRRIFKMAPLHHHFQKMGYVEPKIVIRFWIVGILLAALTIITLKLR